MKSKIYVIVAALVCLSGVAPIKAQQQIDTSTRIFNPAFRTLKVQNVDNFMMPPVIRLNSNDRLIVTFDELGDEMSYLQYSFVHCNADWQPSGLIDSEYIDGFNIARVTDYAYSANTYIHYMNYCIEIPNDDIRVLTSGNYLLKVYREDEPEETILQARFSVVDPQVSVSGTATDRTDKGFQSMYQQLNLRVSTSDYQIRDPYSDLIVVVTQNGRPETRTVISHPQRVQGSTLIYEHVPGLIFPAGNEYRRFETVRVTYPGMHVDSTRYVGPNYHAWLMVDQERATHDYLYDSTQKGRYMIDEYNASDPNLGADYVTVHFRLDHPYLSDADIYVEGEFTQHHRDRGNRLVYNSDTHLYELQMPLKQGSYNYQYVVVPRTGGKASSSPVEGDKYETANEYTIEVWHRTPGARADQLVGYTTIIK